MPKQEEKMECHSRPPTYVNSKTQPKKKKKKTYMAFLDVIKAYK